MNIKLSKAHKLSRRIKFRGLNISIETDKGELRHWYDPHNKTKGTTKMLYPYGYIRRTEGVDGDHVDAYVGPKEDAPNVYIVNQMKAPDFKKFDEQKCMIGFSNAKEAKSAYLKHYNDNRFFGNMTIMPWNEFEKKVKKTFEQPKKIAAFGRKKETQKNILGTLAAGAVTPAVILANTQGVEKLLSKPYLEKELKAVKTQGGPLSSELLSKLRKAMRTDVPIYGPHYTAEDLKAFPKQLSKMLEKGISFAMPLGPARGAFLSPKATLPHAAHELGHATGSSLLRGQGFIGNPMFLARHLPILGAVLADPESTTAKTMPYLSAGLGTPRFLEELRATTRGLRGLHRMGARGGLKSLLPALGIYGIQTLGPALGIEAVRRLKKHVKEGSVMTPLQKAYTFGKYIAKKLFEEKTAGLFSPKQDWMSKITPEQWDALYETQAMQALHKQLGLPQTWYGHPELDTAVMQEAQKLYDPEYIAKQKTLAKTSASLGDPNYWQGGTPLPEEMPTPAQTAEEAVHLLPAGTFQGAQIKITPDGQRNTTVKVTPDAVAQPDALANVFNAEPNAKVEISQADMGKNEEIVPPEFAAGKMAARKELNIDKDLLEILKQRKGRGLALGGGRGLAIGPRDTRGLGPRDTRGGTCIKKD